MNKKPIVFLLALLLPLAVWSQSKHVVLPGKGHIDVEQLNRNVNLKMDISNLSISELHVLRNAFAARQGYPFEDATLRAIYNATSWYPDTLYGKWAKDEELEMRAYEQQFIKMGVDVNTATEEQWKQARQAAGFNPRYRYSAAEQAFIKRLKAREEELLKANFSADSSQVRVDNLVNTFQLDTIQPALMSHLAKDGFAIVPARHNQLFHVYEKNDYGMFPNFVTTDLFLQLFHFYFDAVLRDVEEQRLDSVATVLCRKVYAHFSKGSFGQAADDAEWCRAYMAVALKLLTDTLPAVSSAYKPMVEEELQHVEAAEDAYSRFLGPDYSPTNVPFAYSLFRPRGHYTRSETAGRYFRAMMWLQSVPLGTDHPEQLRRAALLAEAVTADTATTATYRRLEEPLTLLMGAPDNVTILQVADVWRPMGKPVTNTKAMKRLRRQVEEIARRQMHIVPAFVHTSRYKVNFMPQRYQPDAEMLLQTIDTHSRPSLRPCPKGLDVAAAMGVGLARDILLNDSTEHWDSLVVALDKAVRVGRRTNWQSTIANCWLKTLAEMNNNRADYPFFMRREQWAKKNLNAMLASWAELKHDAILYAKQPAAAECGGGGPEPPVVKGYVEPNVAFWKAAMGLVDSTAAAFQRYGLTTEKVLRTTTAIREQLEFCLSMSQKELQGIEPTAEEYASIRIMGSQIEYITLDLVRNEDQFLMDWNDVQSADKHVAVVADVFTANGDNVPQDRKRILYEATGPAYEIYVVVPVGGYLYLMRGAVLSYREFGKALGEPRLTDEEWQEQVKEAPETGTPAWMEEITAPAEAMPTTNEEVFYSTGC